MPYLILNPDNSIQDVLPDNSMGGVEVTREQMQPIIDSPIGHAVFDFINGEIVQNQSRFDNIANSQRISKKRRQLTELTRQRAIDAMISAQRNQIENMNEAALDAAIEAGGLG